MKNLPAISLAALVALAGSTGSAAEPAAPAEAPKKAPAAEAPKPGAEAPKAGAEAPKAGAEAPKAGAAPEAVVGPPAVAWKDMTKQQKGKFMKMVVTPKMKVAFQAFDGDEFKKFDCGTCHGKDAKAKEFKMPNPGMFVLPSTPEGFGELMKKKPKWMEFMGKTVKPQMAALLGIKEFDPKNPKEPDTFACHACHTMKAH
jgi:hypothetical protein